MLSRTEIQPVLTKHRPFEGECFDLRGDQSCAHRSCKLRTESSHHRSRDSSFHVASSHHRATSQETLHSRSLQLRHVVINDNLDQRTFHILLVGSHSVGLRGEVKPNRLRLIPLVPITQAGQLHAQGKQTGFTDNASKGIS